MIKLSRLEDLKVEAKASGDPRKLAKFTVAKAEYDDLVAFLFDGKDYKYADVPSDSYVQRLKTEAESGDDAAVARYRIIKDAYDYFENRGERFHEFRAGIRDIRSLLDSGDAVTEDHVQAARKYAVMNPTAENLARASLIKQRYADQKAGKYVKPEPPAERKLTQEDVNAAAEKARRTSRTEDIAAYSIIKRQFEAQSTAAAE